VYVGSNSNPCSAAPNLTYDLNGNLSHNQVGPDTWDYAYDDENHLISAKKNGGASLTATFTYDALGRRTNKTVNSAQRNYHYDGFNNHVLYETDSNGNLLVWYNWVGNRLVSQKRSGLFYYYQYNAHGDVIGLYDQSGSQVQQYTYDVWGKLTSNNSNDPIPNPYRYAGYWYDEETGLYNLNARYYDPNLARFISQDTYMPQNLYAYTGNNPVHYTDPTGHRREVCDNGSCPNMEGPYYPNAEATTGQKLAVVGTLFGAPVVAALVVEVGAVVIARIAASLLVGGEQLREAVEAGESTAYHYTSSANAASISADGLQAGDSGAVYATTNGMLSPLQAQIDLALSPNRPTLPDALFRIDLNAVRQLGIGISNPQQVSRFMNMPGGGVEILLHGDVPIKALTRVR
jgi:RHS repeat-associated protein